MFYHIVKYIIIGFEQIMITKYSIQKLKISKV